MAILNEHIVAGAVNATSIADGTVVAAEVADGAITEGKLATGAVTETKIGTGAVTETKIGSSAISTGKIASSAVTAAKIDAATVAVGALLNQPEQIWNPSLVARNLRLDDAGFTDNNNINVSSSGKLYVVPIYLRKGQVVTNISFMTGDAGETMADLTHWWFALFDASKNLLRQTADQLTAGWADNTKKTLALSSPYTVTEDGIFYVGFCVVASAIQNLIGKYLSTLFTPATVGVTSDTELTGTAPAQFGSITPNTKVPMVEIT